MKAIDRLFQRLSLNYGRLFLDMWKDIPIAEVKVEWSEGLAGYPYDEINAALTYCLDHNTYPPTLPEFKRLCKEQRKAPVMRALPRKFTPEEMQANRNRMANIVAGLANSMKVGQ
jgi:hypothetical protein